MTKNVDIDQYKYSGYGIGFDRKGKFSFYNGYGRNVIIFGAYISSSPHIDNKNVTPIKYVLMVNQECEIRPVIINIDSDEPSMYRFSTEMNKQSCSCNYINNPYAKLCVPAVVKNINVKVFNPMSRSNKTRHIK